MKVVLFLLFGSLAQYASANARIELMVCRLSEPLVAPLMDRVFDADPGKLDELAEKIAAWPDDRITVLARVAIETGQPKSTDEKTEWVKQEKGGFHVAHEYSWGHSGEDWREFSLKLAPENGVRRLMEAHLSSALTNKWSLSAISIHEEEAFAFFERAQGELEQVKRDHQWLLASVVPKRTKVTDPFNWQAPAGDKTLAHFLLKVPILESGKAHFRLLDQTHHVGSMNHDGATGAYTQGEIRWIKNGGFQIKASMETRHFEFKSSREERRDICGGALLKTRLQPEHLLEVPPVQCRRTSLKFSGGKMKSTSEKIEPETKSLIRWLTSR